MPKNKYGMETMPANPMTIQTAWVAKLVSQNEDYEWTTELLCVSQDYDTAHKAFIDALPDNILGWQMRYRYWNQETLDKVIEIYPDFQSYPWLKVYEARFGGTEGKPLYSLDRVWNVEEGEETPLTFEQKVQLYELLGSYWDNTSNSHCEYKLQKMALVPLGLK